jgi:hypothetical protein
MRGELCPYDHGNDPLVVEDVNMPGIVLGFPRAPHPAAFMEAAALNPAGRSLYFLLSMTNNGFNMHHAYFTIQFQHIKVKQKFRRFVCFSSTSCAASVGSG